MIISCTSCNKKFEINSDLIPEKGRLVQCSKCNNKWFFTKDKEINKTTKEIKEFSIGEDIESVVEKNNEIRLIENSSDNDKIENKVVITGKNVKSKYKFLNLIIVFIISIIALIIILDTFKSSISLVLPNIEIILYNLYETLKDIMLFLKDLLK
jgi:predicted Zn finger-like uncharacterized protein